MVEKLLYRIRISGQVQGVGFRWNAAHQARKLGITGFAKNTPDGSVYIEAEGIESELKKFIEWCKTGPRSARVESVNHDTLPPANYADFRIES
jgi:acylphosphatase